MMELKNVIAQITHVPYETLALNVGHFTFKRIEKGEFLVKAGEVCKYAAFIKKGVFRSYFVNEKGQEKTICFSLENDFVSAYESYVRKEASELFIEAIETAEVLVLTYPDLQTLYSSNPIWQEIGRVIIEKGFLEKQKYAWILNSEDAEEKYKRLVIQNPKIMQRVKLEHIASYLGVTRRTLTRIRKKLFSPDYNKETFVL